MASVGKQEKTPYRSGFAAIIGRPNVGKSTLLNALIGRKLAIMSNKPQTTRHRIHGVLTMDRAQIVFLDTPGIHKPKHKLGEYMVEAAEAALHEVDVVLFVIDATEPNHSSDGHVLERLQGISTPVFLVINKVDAVEKPEILKIIAGYKDQFAFAEIIPVSALDGTQVAELTDLILKRLPEGPQYYPDDAVTDHPEQFIVAEFVREKVLKLTREEVPHSVFVDVEQMERRENVIYCHVIIYTERESQKGILIGKRGEMLRRIGESARRELEAMFGDKVYLELWVKVKKDWRNEPGQLRRFGFE